MNAVSFSIEYTDSLPFSITSVSPYFSLLFHSRDHVASESGIEVRVRETYPEKVKAVMFEVRVHLSLREGNGER